MKKVIFSVLLIAIVGALVGIGTWAYFSDYETSKDNIFTAGSLDLKVDGEDDPTVETFFNAPCLAPGDYNFVEINLMNEGCVDGVADIHLKNMVSDDNGLTEPESDVDTTGGAGEGELCCNLDMRITADLDGDPANGYEELVAEGKACELWCSNFVIGDIPGVTEPPYNSIDIMIEWWIGTMLADGTVDGSTVGNIIQTDDCSFDIEFSLNQKIGDVDMVITDLIQDEIGFVCTLYQIDAVVHNAGTITGSGWVFVEVKDDQHTPVWSDKYYVENLAPCSSTTVSFFWHPTAPGNYTAQDPVGTAECPMIVEAPPEMEITGIQQPDDIQLLENLTVSVDLHNRGTVPGPATVDAWIEDDEGEIAGTKQQDTVASVPPCTTTKVVFDFGIVPEAWRGTIWVVAQIGDGPLFKCEIEVLAPATWEIVKIWQPDEVQVCEEIIIEVEVHNAGDKSGECEVKLWITDAGGTTIWPDDTHETGTTALLNPCDTEKVQFGPIHIDEAWDGTTMTVHAEACGDDSDICTIDVVVVAPPCIMVVNIQQPDYIEWCEELVVAVDIHNAGGKSGTCSVEWWITDEFLEPIGDPAIGGIIDPTPEVMPCEIVKIPIVIGHPDETWPPIILIWARACCGEPIFCPIAVLPPQDVWMIPTTAYGSFALTLSMLGQEAGDPLVTPAISGWLMNVSKTTTPGSEYRAVTVPQASYSWYPICSPEPMPEMFNNYTTINVVATGDGSGKLYVVQGDPADIDVDVHGESCDALSAEALCLAGGGAGVCDCLCDAYPDCTNCTAGTCYVYGDGTPDPPGSLSLSMPLEAETWLAPGTGDPPDPLDSTTWGDKLMTVPLDFEFTTEVSFNHVNDAAEAATAGVALDCNPVSEQGVPFELTGGLANYVGTVGYVAGTGASLDQSLTIGPLTVELDVQYQMKLGLAPWEILPTLTPNDFILGDTLSVSAIVHRIGSAPGNITLGGGILDLYTSPPTPVGLLTDKTTKFLYVCGSDSLSWPSVCTPSHAGDYAVVIGTMMVPLFVVNPDNVSVTVCDPCMFMTTAGNPVTIGTVTCPITVTNSNAYAVQYTVNMSVVKRISVGTEIIEIEVYKDRQTVSLGASASTTVSFSWTPTVAGTYYALLPDANECSITVFP